MTELAARPRAPAALTLLGLCIVAIITTSSATSATSNGGASEKGLTHINAGGTKNAWAAAANKCSAELLVQTKAGVLDWPSTDVDRYAQVECPFGPSDDRWRNFGPRFNSQHGTAFARRKCSLYCYGPTWEEADVSACKPPPIEMTPQEAEDAAYGLTESTSDPSKIDGSMFNQASNLLEGIFPHALVNKSLAGLMFQTVSNLVDTNFDVLKESDPDGGRGRRLYGIVEQYTRDVDLSDRTGHTFNFQNLNLRVVAPTLPVTDSDSGDVQFTSQFDSSGSNTRITIPTAAVRKAIQTVADQAVRVQFIALRNGNLLRPPGLSGDGNIQQPVMTAAFGLLNRADDNSDTGPGEIPIQDLDSSDPVVIDMPYAYPGASHVCAYYDPLSDSWRDDNVATVQSGSREQHIQCQSSHLTAFTLLLDPYPRQGLGELRGPLDIITNVGCWISMIGLVITAITYTAFRFGRNRWGRVLVNLCLSLALLNITCFLANLKGTLPLWACATVAVAVHASMLCAFCWMLVEALLLYQLLITVFQPTESHFILKRVLFGWGFPWLIVIAAAVYDFRYYGDTNSNYCMPSTANVGLNIVVMIMPCVGVLIANVVIFLQVACVLLRQRKVVNNNKDQPKKVTWAQIRGVLGVAFLLGITWVMSPLLAAQPWLQVISALTNSLQGTIIFVSRVVRPPEARRCWLRVIGSPNLQFRLRAQPSTASYSLDKGSIWSKLKWSGSSSTVAASPTSREGEGERGARKRWAFWTSQSSSAAAAEWTKGSSVSYDIHI